MHSYKTLLAGDILHLPLTRSVSINKRPPKKAQGHVTLRPRSQGIEAYATDRTAGVSPHLLGISHSLQDILKPSINVVQVRRQPPADIIGLADLLRDIPSFKAQVSMAFDHPCTRSPEAAQEIIDVHLTTHSHGMQSTCTRQPDSVQQAVKQLLSYLPDHRLSQMLCADMQSIIHEFAYVSGTSYNSQCTCYLSLSL